MDDQIVRGQISHTINRLKKVNDITSVNEQLRQLNIEVQKQKSLLPDEAYIREAAQTTNHFKGMNTSTLIDELESISQQDELPPKLQDELSKLFAKLTENTTHAQQRHALDQIQGKTGSQDTLKEIVDMLRNIEQLNHLDTLLTEKRKDIALASIENKKLDGGIANSNNAHGQESGNREVQGTQEKPGTNKSIATDDDTSVSIDEENTEKALIGDEIPSIIVPGTALTLDSDTLSKNGSITRVFTGQRVDERTEPNYMSFRDVVLSAQREYAKALENNRIPVRFRSQIKAYLKDISEINE